jgi:hypothetical protein
LPELVEGNITDELFSSRMSIYGAVTEIWFYLDWIANFILGDRLTWNYMC